MGVIENILKHAREKISNGHLKITVSTQLIKCSDLS